MKHFLFDVDGVLILSSLFSTNLHQQYGVPLESALSFIHGEYQDCVTGEKDLKQILPHYIQQWHLSLTVDQLLDFWFESENHPNQILLDYINQLRQRGYLCSVATNQEKYRVAFIKDQMHFADYFDHFFTSAELGIKKPHPDYYHRIATTLKVDPTTLYFFDDRPNYADAATLAGWHGYHFVDTKETITQIQQLVNF